MSKIEISRFRVSFFFQSLEVKELPTCYLKSLLADELEGISFEEVDELLSTLETEGFLTRQAGLVSLVA